ncbi:MAG: hypothetical protein IRZ15_09470 [Bryobacteraceae bacterium]|nr:hypothetical protein [Bryobacteraceae bacterium]
MEDTQKDMEGASANGQDSNLRNVIRDVIQEFIRSEQAKAEPAYKAELLEERRRREQLERRVNELVDEAAASRRLAEEADRYSQIRTELQRLGVAKIDLAFRAVKDDIYRAEDGRLMARSGQGDVLLMEYLTQFVNENPELLPARMSGGSGATGGRRPSGASSGVDLDKIRPGMSAEDRERVRQEIAQLASQTLRQL